MTAAGPGRGVGGLAPPMHGELPEPATPACSAWKGGPSLGAEAGGRKWVPGLRALVTPAFPASSAPWGQFTTLTPEKSEVAVPSPVPPNVLPALVPQDSRGQVFVPRQPLASRP